MKIGVHNYKTLVDFSGVSDYLKGLVEEYEKKAKDKKKFTKMRIEDRASRLSEALTQLDEDFFGNLTKTLRLFAALDECPEDLRKLFYRERDMKLSSGRVVKRRLRRYRMPPLFDFHIIPKVNDVMAIEKQKVNENKILFDVVSIKKSGLSAFKKCIESIPPLNEKMKILKEKQQFSQRYVFRPYPLAVELLLQSDASITIPSDLKSFLLGSIRYIFSAEWRTSIVLSAITVESMLADLYEEKHKEPAPDTPLGDLFRHVKGRVNFPSEIVKAIEMTNEARIAAVHRSRFPVSDREAINALFGATNFSLWYSSQS